MLVSLCLVIWANLVFPLFLWLDDSISTRDTACSNARSLCVSWLCWACNTSLSQTPVAACNPNTRWVI